MLEMQIEAGVYIQNDLHFIQYLVKADGCF